MREAAGDEDFACDPVAGRGPLGAALTLDAFIGRQIRLARSAQGVSLRDLAKLLNVPVEILTRFEAGAVHIGPTMLVDIAAVLELRIGYFFGLPDQAAGSRRPARQPGLG